LTGEKIRVVLADDHTMFRQGLAEILSTDPEIEVVGEAENGAEAVELVREQLPDVVILDVEMPVMGAEEAMQRIFEVSPPPKVVIVTMFEEPGLVRRVLSLGASGFLAKSASMEELLTAVHTAAGGDNLVLAVPREVLQRVEKGPSSPLSPRELEVVLCAARGMSNRQTAASLHLSEATVKRHLANVYAKLEVGSRSEAARRALSEGWISARDVTRSD
jgi:DNA-binding NarL/FixJ family response regulator